MLSYMIEQETSDELSARNKLEMAELLRVAEHEMTHDEYGNFLKLIVEQADTGERTKCKTF